MPDLKDGLTRKSKTSKMYAIPNSQRAEIAKLLAALKELPGTDTRTANIKRRATLATRKLNKAKIITNAK